MVYFFSFFVFIFLREIWIFFIVLVILFKNSSRQHLVLFTEFKITRQLSLIIQCGNSISSFESTPLEMTNSWSINDRCFQQGSLWVKFFGKLVFLTLWHTHERQKAYLKIMNYALRWYNTFYGSWTACYILFS